MVHDTVEIKMLLFGSCLTQIHEREKGVMCSLLTPPSFPFGVKVGLYVDLLVTSF